MTGTIPRRVAAIDLGSHSAKLTVSEAGPAGWRPVLERVEITGLGRGEPRRDGLDPAARATALEVLGDFARLLRETDAREVAVAGTAVLRHARDAAGFLQQVRELTGLPLEVISGDEEARLTYLGAVASLPPVAPGATQLVFDIGGASTELAWGAQAQPDGRRSLELGTIDLTRRHRLDAVTSATALAAAVEEAAHRLDDPPVSPAPSRLVGIGATPATLLALQRGRDLADSAEVHGVELARAAIADQLERLRRRAASERAGLPGLHPGRAEVVLAGAAITMAVAARWPDAPVVLSAHGLRDGLLRDRFGEAP